MRAFDEAVLQFTQNINSGAITAAMVFFSSIGNAGAVWLLAAAALLLRRKTRARGVTLLVCLALCMLVNNLLLKNLIARPRPFDALPWLTARIARPADFSFPSGHTAAAFAAACALARGFSRRIAIPAYLLASLIAVSRVYVGVHYPSDVLAGVLVGTLCGFLGVYLLTGRHGRRII
ncbi:MAG: phosphatase PAP2 family protein [Oscillospiraceae bacterium]|jgi:undecaprenyl-diphosphatase|nr:phosphatase PAP2 family protein [Oscillospiraceae bacterium]